MPEGCEERALFREALIGALRAYAEDLANRYAVKLIILYGSFARGDWRPGSDADLLIVAEGLPPTYGARWDLFHALVMGVPVEPHAYTPEEFEEMLEHGRMTALDALTEGIVLYAEPDYLASLRRELEDVKKRLGLKKAGDAWLREARAHST